MSTRILTPLILLLSALLSGCLSSFNLDRQTVDLTKPLKEINFIAQASGVKKSNCPASSAAVQRGSLSAAALMTSLPKDLRGTDILDALAKEYHALLEPPPKPLEFSFDTAQFKTFADILSNTLYSPASQIANANDAESTTDKALKLFKEYFSAYIHGEFVDSRGTALSKPSITAQGIGNESISAALIVLLEAAADSALKTPVLCKNVDAAGNTCEIYLNAGNMRPTRMNFIKPEGVVDPGTCGVTEGEAKAIVFLSELAAEQAELMSGMIVETFGGGEAGFIVAGHFSVGDNKTLATIVKTFFENVFRRASTHALYEAFRKLDSPATTAKEWAANPLGRELATLKSLQQP